MSVNPAVMQDDKGIDSINLSCRTRASLTNPLGVNWVDGAGTPVSSTPGASVTITAANILTGIITYAPSTPSTATFDTAANIVAAVNSVSAGAVVGDCLTVLIMNGSGTNAITLAGGTGITFDANLANRSIAVNNSRWCILRLTNVTPGSEAATIYF